MNHLPLTVIAVESQAGTPAQVAELRNQIESAGAAFLATKNLSVAEVMDLISLKLEVGPVAVLDSGLVTGQAMIDALVKGNWSASGALVRPNDIPTMTQDARVMHKRIVSSATADHRVTQPTHVLLGFVRIGMSEESQLALQSAKEYANSSSSEINIVDLITLALIRTGCSVVAINSAGVCKRALQKSQVSNFRNEVFQQDEEQVRIERAMRTDDGFYSTFVLRKFSRRLSILAVSKGWTPNQITLSSLLLALAIAALFSTGWWPAMVIGAIGVQLSIIIDCSDGEVARYTGVSSQRGAWLDAATDRIKEYALYAGLAFGAGLHGINIWPLAMGVMILQTVRHMSDYNFHAVQVIRETAIRSYPMSAGLDAGVKSNGTLLDSSAQLNSNRGLRWLKKIIHLPIGERWLVISLGALFNAPMATLWTLLILGGLSLAYTTLGRVLRSKAWRHPKEVSGSEIIERQIDPGLGVDWFWADGSDLATGRFAWMIPALLRLFELGLVLVIARDYPLAYLWIFAVAFHHYDTLYRSLAGFEIPRYLKTPGLGFLGRSLIVVMSALGFIVPLEVTLLIGGIGFTALFVGFASKQWMQQIT